MCLPEILKGSESESAMDREEAIKALQYERKTALHENKGAFDMAIEALSTSEISNKCEDAISRQAVMDAMYDLCGEESLKDNPWRDNPHIDSITDAIEHLPSVTPKQKMGRWIREKKHHKDGFQEFDYWDVWCSECGARKRIGWTNIRHCPMCGAKMEESEDAE